MDKIIVTRHQALIDYLKEIGIIDGNEPIVAHATADDVRDKHVIGVVPLSLACLAKKVTEVPLLIPSSMRGKELSIDDMRRYADSPVTYKVTVIDGNPSVMTPLREL